METEAGTWQPALGSWQTTPACRSIHVRSQPMNMPICRAEPVVPSSQEALLAVLPDSGLQPVSHTGYGDLFYSTAWAGVQILASPTQLQSITSSPAQPGSLDRETWQLWSPSYSPEGSQANSHTQLSRIASGPA